MAVDHPFDGLVGHLADAIEQIAGDARMGERVDQEHALLGNEKCGIRPAIGVVIEIKIARDLLDLAGVTLLRRDRRDHDHDQDEQSERPDEEARCRVI
jgi:hypothetical protein